MKVCFIALSLTLLSIISSTQSAKLIKSQHPNRRLASKPERELIGGFFDSSSTDLEMDNRSEHRHMALIMDMVKKNQIIKRILASVKAFSINLDDMAENMNGLIVDLASIATRNLNKIGYISAI